MQQTATGATQARRAAIARRRVSHQPNPALVEHADQRAESIENRIADRITRRFTQRRLRGPAA